MGLLLTTGVMPAFSQQLQRILIFDPDKARATVSVFFDSYTPDGLDTPCHIFLLAEIRTAEHEKNQYLIREIQNQLFRYFDGARARMTESLFEEGLHEINKMLPTLLTERPANFLNEITLIAGTVFGNVLHFSQAGDATMLYLHNGKILDIGDHSISARINPLKVFQEVGTGKIEPNDSLFIGTTNFLDYFSQEKIRRMIEESEKESVTKRFDDHLAQAPLSTSFAALLVEVTTGKAISVDEYIKQHQEHPQPQKQMRSIEELIQREESTDEILAPKLLPALYKRSLSFFRSLRTAFRKYVLKKPTRISPIVLEKEEERGEQLREAYLRKMRHNSRGSASAKISKTYSSIAGSSTKTLSKIQGGVKSLFTKKVTKQLAPEVRSEEKRKINILFWFKQLTLQRKIVFIVFILVLVIFAQSMVTIGQRQRNEVKNVETQTQVQNIRDQIAEIDASFLYGDDARVRDAIALIESTLNDLPESDETQEIVSQAREKIAQAKNQLRKIRVVPSPTLLTDLANQTENGAVESIISVGEMIFSLVPEKNLIVRTTKAAGESISINGKASSVPQYFTTLGTSVVIVHQDLSISELRQGSTTLTSMTSEFAVDANIASIASYLSRLYAVDINRNQILRANRGASGYGIPSEWLSESNASFSSARALAVDGSIYVGFQEGTVKKYTQGVQDSFSLQQLDDPIQSLTKIWTNENTGMLYVLDQPTRRVIMFDKEGKLVEQLFFENLPSIASFDVDEAANRIYVLSAGKIYWTEVTPTE